MGRSKPRQDKHDEARVRIIWDRFDTYADVGAVVRGRGIGPRRVAFFDREQGILPIVPAIEECLTVDEWPRGQRAQNLASMSLSIDPTDRRAGLAIVSTRSGGTWLDESRPCVVYFLTPPEESDALPAALPIGGYVPTAGQTNWAVGWDELRDATSVAELRAAGATSDSTEDDQ